MRIGYFVWEYPPLVVAGLGTVAENICQQLVNHGHDVSVFSMNDGTLKTRETVKGVDVNRPILVDGSTILPQLLTMGKLRGLRPGMKFITDVLIYNILSAAKFTNELQKKEGEQFDVICAHDWLSAMAGIIIKRETDIPFVFHLYSTGGFDEDGATVDGAFIRYIEETAAQVADRVITVCYPLHEYLTNHGFDARKEIVCWNAVNTDKFDPTRVERNTIEVLRSSYGIEPDEKMLLFMGEISDITNLVRAMPLIINMHPEAKLVIRGKGELEQTVSALIEELNLGEKVKTRFEYLSNEERLVHYGASDAVICPSLRGPCSIISLEAMSMNKPIVMGSKGICSTCDHIYSSEVEQTGIQVDGSTAAELAWGINSLLDDMEKAEEMGKRGRKKLKNYFTWEKIAKHTIGVYEEVARHV